MGIAMSTTALLLFGLGIFSAVGSGLVAGVLFAFSSFVMNALARLPAAQGVRAMQVINLAVTKSLFILLFVGTAIASTLMPILVVAMGPVPGARYLVAGSVLYLAGTVAKAVAEKELPSVPLELTYVEFNTSDRVSMRHREEVFVQVTADTREILTSPFTTQPNGRGRIREAQRSRVSGIRPSARRLFS